MGWKTRQRLAGPRVYARPPVRADQDAWLALMDASVRELRKWGDAPSGASFYRRYIDKMSAPTASGLFVYEHQTDALVGIFNVTNIIRGPLQQAFVGYYAHSHYTGRGYMTEGFGLALRHAFTRLDLHRIEANIQPENLASKRLAERAGLRLEGYSPRYLFIKGAWRDHERWAITREDWAT